MLSRKHWGSVFRRKFVKSIIRSWKYKFPWKIRQHRDKKNKLRSVLSENFIVFVRSEDSGDLLRILTITNCSKWFQFVNWVELLYYKLKTNEFIPPILRNDTAISCNLASICIAIATFIKHGESCCRRNVSFKHEKLYTTLEV